MFSFRLLKKNASPTIRPKQVTIIAGLFIVQSSLVHLVFIANVRQPQRAHSLLQPSERMRVVCVRKKQAENVRDQFGQEKAQDAVGSTLSSGQRAPGAYDSARVALTVGHHQANHHASHLAGEHVHGQSEQAD